MNNPIFDSDNHYYEPEDCFTRYGDERIKRYVTWVTEGKKRHLLFGQVRTNDLRNPRSVMNPTFNPVARPGIYHDTLRQLETGSRGQSPGDLFRGALEPIPAAYRTRSARLATMDEQGVERVLMFPTLGITVLGYMADDPELLYSVVHSFNLWIDDDWGLNRDNRIYAPPIIAMANVEGAVAELEWALDRGARIITIQPGPVYGRSPADTYFDPFWARVNEAGVVVGYHGTGGVTSYNDVFKAQWGQASNDRADYLPTLSEALNPLERPMMDTATALILGNLFGRFPNVKVASIEMGSAWVRYLLHALDHAGGLLTRQVTAFGSTLKDRPSDVFRERFWVAPFPEDDVVDLVNVLGADHVLMGSDWPHAEGTPTPAAYAACLTGLDDAKVRRVMYHNALDLVGA